MRVPFFGKPPFSCQALGLQIRFRELSTQGFGLRVWGWFIFFGLGFRV